MIHSVEDGFVISSGGSWRTGVYEDERTAKYAFRFTDAELYRLQQAANARNGGRGGIITYDDLKALAKSKKTPHHRQRSKPKRAIASVAERIPPIPPT